MAVRDGRERMRAFIIACCAVIAIAVGAAVVLDGFVQEIVVDRIHRAQRPNLVPVPAEY